MFDRRSFIKSTLVAGLSTKVLFSNQLSENQIINSSIVNNSFFPLKLKQGAKIAITAPASPVSIGEIMNAITLFKKMKCTVEIGETIKNRHNDLKYFSAPDDERAMEFMQFIERKDIDCIMCGRGGYGVMRILPFLDFEKIRNNPKIIIGYSDITALINAINVKTGMITYHGPVAAYLNDNFSVKSLTDALFLNKSEPLKITKKNIIAEGNCNGRIVGGNLSMITSTLGTPYEIDTKDSILFLEETSEEPYKIDRMLTHLKLSGKIDSAVGLIFGYFKNMDSRRNFFPGLSFTVRQIITQMFAKLGKPCLIEMPIGHTKYNMTLPIGGFGEIDTKNLFFRLKNDIVRNDTN
jgi:muramoyltetrapeptide carboxypeptidase